MDPASSPEGSPPPESHEYRDYTLYGFISEEQLHPPRSPSALTTAVALLILGSVIATLAFTYVRLARSHDTSAGGGARGPRSVFALKPGDCFHDASPDDPFGTGLVRHAPNATTVDAVPCTSPHNGEAYGSYDATGAATAHGGAATVFPDQTTLVKDGDAKCGALHDAFVMDQLSLPEEAVDRRYYPTAQDWQNNGRHRVTCYLRFPSDGQRRSVREDASVLVPEQIRYLRAVKAYNDLVGQLDPTTLSPADPSGDPVAWTDMRDLARTMPAVAQAEAEALRKGPWSPAVRNAVDVLLAVKADALPIWRQAGQAQDEATLVSLLNQAESSQDHDAAVDVRAQLGLSTKEGQRPLPPGQQLYV